MELIESLADGKAFPGTFSLTELPLHCAGLNSGCVQARRGTRLTWFPAVEILIFCFKPAQL